jgi:hypothetical protein
VNAMELKANRVKPPKKGNNSNLAYELSTGLNKSENEILTSTMKIKIIIPKPATNINRLL